MSTLQANKDDLERFYAEQRRKMVHEQLARRGIVDKRVLQAMSEIPRHLFVPEEVRSAAYQDSPLPIGYRQTISQPYIVALMTQMLGLGGHEKVLEIGTGSGYQAAILARLAGIVQTIERHPTLSEAARRVIHSLDISNVIFQVGDGSLGFAEQAPYDAILVTAGAPSVPEKLLEQLSERGRLVIPVGKWKAQTLERWWRTPAGLKHESVAPVAFVPLVGKEGWDTSADEDAPV
ncbi:MAG TPA: protein-L-isoaspartate(D-aspartate) O-methyltransferase [Anaerolineales bacterium]|nr:protein-L-isoaspartate(D-aspartate) O-methyltransferase [Anaerolineales bacterium]